MLDYQRAAVSAVREYAVANSTEHHVYVKNICDPFNVDAAALAAKVLSSPVTINFHPDRLSGNGNTIMENLFEQGQYLSQFRTGTSNGGTGIYKGGNRFTWEQNMFFDSYPHSSLERPKYGALNLFRYIDGASARFGACFFTLKHHVKSRCTFAYGDSSANPTALCTSDTFISIVAAMLEDVERNHRLLNQVVAHRQAALAIMLNPCEDVKILSKNLDYCIETHIHGDVSLADDVESFYLDESYRQTTFETQAKELCKKYEISLHWIPRRQIATVHIGELFRGPKIPLLAHKINSEYINAALIGDASRDCAANYRRWQELGTEAELFQYFKQLWHTVAYFG